MKIKITSKIGGESEIKELAEIAGLYIDHSSFEVHVKNSSYAFRGRGGYQPNKIVRVNKYITHMATTCISLKNIYPYHYQIKRYGIDTIIFYTWQEMLLWLIAHELYHCEQSKYHRPLSERLACNYASNRLNDYRMVLSYFINIEQTDIIPVR